MQTIKTSIQDRQIDPGMVSTIIWHKTIGAECMELPIINEYVLISLDDGTVSMAKLQIDSTGGYEWELADELTTYMLAEVDAWAKLPAMPYSL